MRAIRKAQAPASLVQYRHTAGATYEGYRETDDLRRQLAAEQRGLCCYCLGRIRPTAGEMKIEHWHSQSAHPAEQLDYGNLLGACLGGEGRSYAQHCDTRKGKRDISRNPAEPAHHAEDFVRYLGDGSIEAVGDPTFDRELNDTLNLNAPFLVANRAAVLDGFKEAIEQGTRTTDDWRRSLRDWNGDGTAGDLRPYCQVVVYWLRKRLAPPTGGARR